MLQLHCASPFRVAEWVFLCLIIMCGQMRALDPDRVVLKATQAQPLVDGRYQVSLQWNALNGATYRVQGQEGLSPTGWLDFGLVTPSGATGNWTSTIAAGLVDEGRFFMRLVLPEERIKSLEPAFVPGGGGVFYVLGQCFSTTDRVFINGIEATVVVFEDHTQLKVTLPATAAGVYDVEVRGSDGATVLAKLPDSLNVTPTGRSDEVIPETPRSVVVAVPAGKVRVTMPDDIHSGDTISGTVTTEPTVGKVRPPTGENTLKKSDLVVPGRGLRFFWGRTYRSKNGPSTAQGEGWDFSYNIRAVQSGGDVVVHDGEGRADTFFNQGDGTWSRPEFFRQGTMSGPVFTLMFADKTTWRFRAFDAALAAGKIDRITDRNGNHLDFGYDGSGRLQTITDTLSRNYTVAYNGAGRIASVTDFSGRAVTYGYDAAGDLITVTSPPVLGTVTGNDFPAGKTVTYGYSSGFADARLNHNLLTVTDALGHVVQTNTYAATLVPTDLEFDRWISQSWDPGPPYPTEEVSFYYLPLTPGVANRFATTLTIINDHGNVTEVRSDSRNRPLEVREYTGRSTPGVFVTDVANRPTGQLRAGDPPFFATAFSWNSDSLPVRIDFPRGGLQEKWFQGDFDPPTNPNPRERGNLLMQVTTAAPAVPSDFTTITQTWQYLPGFGASENAGSTFMVPSSIWAAEDVMNGDSDQDQNDVVLRHQSRRLILEPDHDLAQVEVHRSPFATGSRDTVIPIGPGSLIPPYTPTSPPPGHTDDFNPSLPKQPPAPPSIKLPEDEEAPFKFDFKVGCAPGFSGECAPKFSDAPEVEVKFSTDSENYCPKLVGAHIVTSTQYPFLFLTGYVDPKGNVWTQGFDLNGNPLTVNPPIAGTEHTFEYNGFGQPTVHIWPPNANGSARRDEFNYYSAGPQAGWLQSCVVDATGTALTTTFEYNAVGVTTRVIDPLGKDTLVTPNALNQPVRISSREASAGVRYETDIRYDANNNVTSIDVQNKDETGALVVANPYFTTQYQYDALNRLVSVTREVDAATTITTERVIDANNHTVTFRSPEAVAGTQPLNTVRHAFDERGLLFETTRAPGAAGQSTTQFDYDLDGNVAAIRCGLELVPQVWLLSWDGNPGIVANARPANIHGSFDGNSSNTNCGMHGGVPAVLGCIDRCLDQDQDNYGVHRAGPRSCTDPMGNKTTHTYDANGNRIAVRVDGEHGDVDGDVGNVRLAEFNISVDNNDLPVVFTSLLLDPLGAQTGSVTASVTRAPNGQPASVTDPRGNVTTFGYDTANRLALVTDAKTNTRALAYDANGNVLTVTATDKSDLANPNQVFVVTRTFDGLDRALTNADNVGNTTQYRYDSRSNLVLHTDARNIQTRFVFDGLSRALSTARDMDNDGASAADPQDIVTSRTWDRNSRLVTSTNANGFVTTHAYDALNRPVGTQEADGTTSGVAYDVHDNVTQSQDANGTVIQFFYDALNRPAARIINPGPGVAGTTTGETLGYDGLSRVKFADSTGSAPTSTSRTYDSLSRVLTETQGAHTVTRAHDAAGNVTTLTYPGGNVVTTTYDSLNRPLAVTDSVSGAIITNAYIGPDRIERQTHGNGTVTTYQYDGVQGVANPPGDLGWRQVSAKFVTGPGGTPTHDARQFFFDANQNRIKRINVPTNLVHTHTLDAADRLVNTVVQQGPPIRNSTYALDKEGNRLNVAGLGDPHPGAYQMNPTLPNPGDAQMNQYTLAPTGQFTYDANGNRQNHNTGPATLQHLYDYANRLVAVNNLTTSQPVATYQYDALSRRVQKIQYPGGVPAPTNFIFNGGSIIEERDGGGAVVAKEISLPLRESEIWWFSTTSYNEFGNEGDYAGLLAVVIRSGSLHTCHADPNGSVMLLTNTAGMPAERYDYQDFGEPQFFSAAYAPQASSALGNPVLFCGWRYDSEISLYRIGNGVLRHGMYGFAGGGGAGKANVQDLSFTNSSDKSSPKLLQAMSVGNNFEEVRVTYGSRNGYFDPKTGRSLTR